jgi:hypothetical protein
MEEYRRHVQRLRDEIHAARIHMQNLQRELLVTLRCLEEECQKQGHLFQAEDNGDYHKPGFHYTCTRCEYFTTRLPPK